MTTARRGPQLSIIPAEAVTDPAVPPMALKILAALGRHTDRAGFCFRSLRKLADELALARSTVQRAIAQLIEAGWLIRFRGQRKDGGDCSSGFRVLRRRAAAEREREDDFEPPKNPVYHDKDDGPGMQPGGPQGEGPQENGPIKTSSGGEQPDGRSGEAAFVRKVKRGLENLGWTVTPAWFRHGDAPIKAWFWGGCDIDRDVLPTILSLLLNARERPSSLAYFTKAIFRARNARLEIETLSPDHPVFHPVTAAKRRAERAAYHAAFNEVEAELLAEDGA